MRSAILLAATFLAAGAHAAMPLTVETCRTMKTEAMRQQCLLSAVDAPASITGKTYSTRDVVPNGPTYIEIPPPVSPVMPYVNVTPTQGGQPPKR
jgi:hypothetical protein